MSHKPRLRNQARCLQDACIIDVVSHSQANEKRFLSHSSNDKARYVRPVAQELRPNMTVFDEATFEEGMQTSSEILKGLDATDIFVVFARCSRAAWASCLPAL